jgi:hypothetical protein
MILRRPLCVPAAVNCSSTPYVHMCVHLGPPHKSMLSCSQVVVRCRPLNSREQSDGRERIVDMDVDAGQIRVG